MNIIAIDPSLISTAMLVYNSSTGEYKIYNYCRESDVYGKTGMRKWYKLAEHLVDYRIIKYRTFETYSEGEITKLKDYDAVTDTIISDIKEYIDISKPTKIGIEGYSMGSQVGDLIDLVTFSSLLRNKLHDEISKEITIISPSTLKLEASKLTYKPEVKEIGGKNPRKEYKWKNNIGIPGGKFQKPDMYYAIVENNTFNDRWSTHCREMLPDLSSVSNIPKPYEDVNDVFLLYKVIDDLVKPVYEI